MTVSSDGALAYLQLTFYDRHFARDSGGKLLLKPAQSLETYPDAVNPLPDIAGLRWALEGLLKLPLGSRVANRRDLWRRLLAQLPPLPVRTESGQTFLLPAQQILAQPINSEDPELYALLPPARAGQDGGRGRLSRWQSAIPEGHACPAREGYSRHRWGKRAVNSCKPSRPASAVARVGGLWIGGTLPAVNPALLSGESDAHSVE